MQPDYDCAGDHGNRRGQVTYNSDYTFSYREDGKGEGTGIWQPSDEQLCEAFDPTSFMPRGSPSRCHPFSAIDNTYTVGTKKLLAKYAKLEPA